MQSSCFLEGVLIVKLLYQSNFMSIWFWYKMMADNLSFIIYKAEAHSMSSLLFCVFLFNYIPTWKLNKLFSCNRLKKSYSMHPSFHQYCCFTRSLDNVQTLLYVYFCKAYGGWPNQNKAFKKNQYHLEKFGSGVCNC